MSADLSLRPATPDDADTVAGLFLAARRAAVPEMPPPVHPDAETHAWFAEQLSASGDREVWLAEQDGVAVGFMMLDPEWLHSLYVAPGATGQGVGTMLLDLAKTLRPDGFGLWVFESNARARAFYSHQGLVEAERTDGSDNEEHAPDIRMVWSGEVAQLRARIDAVDDALAALLEERARITARIQEGKPVRGHAGRDATREARIIARMARQAPTLGEAGVARIMDAVISASLDAADR